jgi:protein disulfide-isomerase A1
VKPFALKYKYKIQFGFIDALTSKQTVEDMHLDTSPNANWPTFAIRDSTLNHRYLFSKEEQTMPNQQQLEGFLEAFFAKTLMRTIRSEPVPEEPQQFAIQTIVASTFDTLVLNNEKDVFLEYYTQSCGPCKVMAPEWEKLAILYKSHEEGREKVMIGKIDMELNDVPTDIRGAPWLLLYAAGRKDKPVLYLGKMVMEDMARFLRKEGTHGVDALSG